MTTDVETAQVMLDYIKHVDELIAAGDGLRDDNVKLRKQNAALKELVDRYRTALAGIQELVHRESSK